MNRIVSMIELKNIHQFAKISMRMSSKDRMPIPGWK